MSKRFQLGHEPQKKSWGSSEIDQEAEDRNHFVGCYSNDDTFWLFLCGGLDNL